MRRLPFVLPPFLRVSWVSDIARATWAPRFNAIVSAWRVMEWRSVERSLRRCGVTTVAVEALETFARTCNTFGLRTRATSIAGRATEVIVARGRDLEAFERARELRDHDGVGLLLGYPACCRAAFVSRHAEGYEVDPTWPLYCGAQGAGESSCAVAVDPMAGGSGNMLVRWLGVAATPYLPCLPSCPASAQDAERWAQFGEELGFGLELQWAREVLSWPAEWSALHGIAEVKLPVMKFMVRTEATATKYVVQWKGTATPKEAGQGTRFPFKANPHRPMTQSASFTRGLVHIRTSEDSRGST